MARNRPDPTAPSAFATHFVNQLPASDATHRVMLDRVSEDKYAFADHESLNGHDIAGDY
jgi:hypothetical protein